MTNIDIVAKTLDVKKLRECLQDGDDIKFKLAVMKIDRLIRAFFADMQADGKDETVALEYLIKGFRLDNKDKKIADIIFARAKEYVALLNEMKRPESRMKALKELQNRNMI